MACRPSPACDHFLNGQKLKMVCTFLKGCKEGVGRAAKGEGDGRAGKRVGKGEEEDKKREQQQQQEQSLDN